MKSNIRFCLLAFGIMIALVFQQCANTAKKKLKTLSPKVALTSVLVGVNINVNDYRVCTAQRLIKDTLKAIPGESEDDDPTMVKQKDTSYLIWFAMPVLDSLKHVMKSKIINSDKSQNDSINWKWIPVQKEMIISDFNTNLQTH